MTPGPASSTRRRPGRRHAVRRLAAMPLRWRLLGVALGLIAVALSVTALVVSALLNRYLLGQAEQELEVYTSSIERYSATDLVEGTPVLPIGFSLLLVPVGGSEARLIGSAVTESDTPSVPLLGLDDPRVVTGSTFPATSPDGNRWLAMARATSDDQAVFIVALPLRSLQSTVTQFLWYAGLIGLIALLACAALGWYLVNRTFRPLTRIEDSAAQIAGGDLTRRVAVPDTRDEVGSLARSLNAMLGRIEQSFAVREANEAKMRRFIADASHELRTPLAAVGGYAELYRQGALPTTDAVTGAMGRIESEARRMSDLVEDLLTLARLDGERPLELQPVDLAVLAADAAQDARTIAPDRHVVATGISGPIEPTELEADERQLRQVVTNLVTNARVHTPGGTPVEILVGRVDDDRVALHVRDHGDGIPEADRAAVFERFYRSDTSRSRGKGGGNGLGLAIVAALVAAHRGTVRVEETPGGGATVVVELPVSPQAAEVADTARAGHRTADS